MAVGCLKAAVADDAVSEGANDMPATSATSAPVVTYLRVKFSVDSPGEIVKSYSTYARPSGPWLCDDGCHPLRDVAHARSLAEMDSGTGVWAERIGIEVVSRFALFERTDLNEFASLGSRF